MFYDPLQEETFAPRINRASKQLAGGLAPLADRQLGEQARKQQRLADLAETYTNEERKEETFAPRINTNLPPGMMIGGRVPLSERDNHKLPHEMPDDPNATHKPTINPSSAALCSDSTRTQLEESRGMRKRVRELWAAHAMDASSMSASGVAAVLRELGIDVNANDAMRLKFHAALGLHAEDPAMRYVQYDRFAKVFGSVLQKAAASRGPGTDGGGAGNGGQPRAQQQQQHQRESYSSEAQRQPTAAAVPTKQTAAAAPRPHPKKAVLRPASAARGPQPSANPAAAARTSRSGSAAAATSRLSAAIQSSTGNNTQQRPQLLHQKKLKVVEPMVPADTQLHRQRMEREAALQQSRKEQARAQFFTKEQLELEECTFAPHTKSFHPPMPATAAGGGGAPTATGVPTLVNAKGFDNAIKRMAAAREQATPAFEDSLRSRALHEGAGGGGRAPSASRPPASVSHRDQHGNTSIKPFRSHLEARQRQKPLLYVDVDMPSGKVGRIGVYAGDRPEDLAKNFCATYGLDGGMGEKLALLLEDRIARAQEGTSGVPQWQS